MPNDTSELINEAEQIAFWGGASPILAQKLKGKQVMVLCSGSDEPVGERIKAELEKIGVKVVYGSTKQPLMAGGGTTAYLSAFDKSELAVMIVPKYEERAENRKPDNGITEAMKSLCTRPIGFKDDPDALPGALRGEELLGSSKVAVINPRKGAPVMRFMSSSQGGVHEFGQLNAGANFANRVTALVK